jgi:hypothetical protein
MNEIIFDIILQINKDYFKYLDADFELFLLGFPSLRKPKLGVKEKNAIKVKE